MVTKTDKQKIFLIGFSGTGKTSAGRVIAAILGWEFYDVDEIIVSKFGKPIEQIFDQDGEGAFRKKEEESISSEFIPALSCVILGGILIWCSFDLPEIGQLTAPIHQHIAPEYIKGSKEDIGIPNIVTSVLASYRGYDTFGETIVVFTAGVAVLALLEKKNPAKKNKSQPKQKIRKNA